MENVMEKEYMVIQVGWEKENPKIPIVLLDKKERDLFNIQPKTLVKVKHFVSDEMTIECLAFLYEQHKQHINKEVTTLNTELAKRLEVSPKESVIITKHVTEEEAKNFQKEVSKIMPFDIIGLVMMDMLRTMRNPNV